MYSEQIRIRITLAGCKKYISENVAEGASREFISNTCRQYISDHLNSKQNFRVVRLLDNTLLGAAVFALAMGALFTFADKELAFMSADQASAFMAAHPWIAVLGPAVLTPKAFVEVEGRLNSRVRAAARLDAVL
jgi:hypothetical protein